MTKTIHFTKMHGLGNDYIYVDTTKYNIANPEELSVILSKPHTGIGSDGLVLIGKSDVADFSMRIFNNDGSEAKMCGNASRCIGKYVYDNGLTSKKSVSLETLAGIKHLQLFTKDGKVETVRVDMGKPVVADDTLTVTANSEDFTGRVVSMGNPHFVILVDEVSKTDVVKTGGSIEKNPAFPDRTNVEFVQLLNSERVRMRVFERGSGVTQACGTGACATVAACVKAGITSEKAEVIMDGGSLTIEWHPGENLYMTGSATKVFDGVIEVDDRFVLD
jgi:diaminopimelate epimerase